MRSALAWAAGCLGVVFCLVLLARAHAVNGANGFPLDDPWIHLTFARTLHEHGSFAYFPGSPTTGGSTSPLYTLILAAGFAIVADEKWLSYGLGIGFQALFLAALFAWARARLERTWAAAVVLLLVALDGRIAILAVSGMETSLFLAAIACAFAARALERPAVAAAALGIAVWVRPEGLILAGVLGIDLLIGWVSGVMGRDRRQLRFGPLVIFVGLVLAYLAFNLVVGGRVMPNTLAAKSSYYGVQSRLQFLRHDVLDLILGGAWPGVALLALVPLAITAAGLMVKERNEASQRLRAECGWVVGLPLAFILLLPDAHRFGRYLVPILPALAILGVAGAMRLGSRLRHLPESALRRGLTIGAGALVAGLLVLHVVSAWRSVGTYVAFCRYHLTRHERCGRWLAENTPADAVVATHDIGAIGFYSRRRIVDIVGLLDPAVVPHLRAPDYAAFVAAYMTQQGVTHLAFLRSWLEVTNVEPLFVADPEPELLEVYAWEPGRTHLVPERVTRLEWRASSRLHEGSPDEALALAREALALDPDNARVRLLEGQTLGSLRRLPEAEAAYERAIVLQAGYPEARFGLATVLAASGRREEARRIVDELVREGRVLPRLEELRARLSEAM